MLRGLAGGRVIVALEGGYNLRSIARSMEAVVRVLLGGAPPEKPRDEGRERCEVLSAGVHNTLRGVLATHAAFWPCLALFRSRCQLRSVTISYYQSLCFASPSSAAGR